VIRRFHFLNGLESLLASHFPPWFYIFFCAIFCLLCCLWIVIYTCMIAACNHFNLSFIRNVNLKLCMLLHIFASALACMWTCVILGFCHGVRSASFRDFTQRWMVVCCGCFETAYWSHVQRLVTPRRFDCMTFEDGANTLSRNVGETNYYCMLRKIPVERRSFIWLCSCPWFSHFRHQLETGTAGIVRRKVSSHLGPLYRVTVSHWPPKEVLTRGRTINVM
jgi:hypothetical protein